MTAPLPASPAAINRSNPLMSDADFKHILMTHLSSLRAFAISLSGKIDSADDLVQETQFESSDLLFDDQVDEYDPDQDERQKLRSLRKIS